MPDVLQDSSQGIPIGAQSPDARLPCRVNCGVLVHIMDKRRSAKSARGAVEPRQGAQAIRRALAVLRILAAGREEGVPLAEVIRATSLTRPTVHRLVHVLIEEGI